MSCVLGTTISERCLRPRSTPRGVRGNGFHRNWSIETLSHDIKQAEVEQTQPETQSRVELGSGGFQTDNWLNQYSNTVYCPTLSQIVSKIIEIIEK